MWVGIEKIWNSEPDVGAELHELAVFVAARRADLGDHARAADGRHAVADRAARAVERRAKTLLGRFDLGEILEPEPELLELTAGDSRQRIARQRTNRLPRDLDPDRARRTRRRRTAIKRFTSGILATPRR